MDVFRTLDGLTVYCVRCVPKLLLIIKDDFKQRHKTILEINLTVIMQALAHKHEYAFTHLNRFTITEHSLSQSLTLYKNLLKGMSSSLCFDIFLYIVDTINREALIILIS